jgi:Rrf2 family protein
MKVSTKGRYGLRAMIDLAIYAKDKKVSIKSISQRQGISENYLEQIIAVLKKNGFVQSTRGAQGGYSLKLNPENISVGDILRALEGDLNPVDCVTVNEDKICEEANMCATKFLWKKISDSINDVVNQVKLKELVDEQIRIDDMISREEH